MKIVGLTGGISAGKSTVSAILRHHDVCILDLDAIAHDILQDSGVLSAHRRVVRTFGHGILDGNAIDRKCLGDLVFSDATKRQQLNRIMQPRIAASLFCSLLHHAIVGTPVLVLDAPLLFETKLDWLCSMRVVVSVDAETQLRRLIERDACLEAQARARIAAQPLSLAAKAARATHVLDNSGSIEQLMEQVARLLPALTACTALQLILRGPVLAVILLVGLVLHVYRHFSGATALLRDWCEPYVAAQPKFWYISAESHVAEWLAYLCAFAVAVGLSRYLRCDDESPAAATVAAAVVPARATAAARVLGVAIALCWPLNGCVKLVQGFELARILLELLLLPCHVYTFMSARTLLSFASTSSRVGPPRDALASLLLHCSWMPLMALLFPDLESAKALAASGLPLAGRASVWIFWGFHVLLLAAPLCAYRLRLGRARSARHAALRLAQYVAFMLAHTGVLLCGVSLLTGRNLNYSLWPPPKLPAALIKRLGGPRYRVSIGAALALVVGPLMRYVVIPAVSLAMDILLIAARHHSTPACAPHEHSSGRPPSDRRSSSPARRGAARSPNDTASRAKKSE